MTESTDKGALVAPATVPAPTSAAAGSPNNPFQRQQADHLNAGAVAIESERAIAEAQGKLVIAQRFPRDPFKAFEAIRAACQRSGFAETAFYGYKRGGQQVSGPSIRMAEELARCWGNIDYGLRELSQRDGVSEMEAYAWDLQTNTMSAQKFTVRHVRDTTEGGKALTSERDVYEITANMGARRMRARILAILPSDYVDGAVAEARRTLALSKEPLGQRISKMVTHFGNLGVTPALIEKRVGHKIDATTAEELVDLHGIYLSIRDGQTRIPDWFDAAPATIAAPAAAAKPAAAAAEQGNAAGAAATASAPAAAAAAAPAAAPGKRGGRRGGDKGGPQDPPAGGAPAVPAPTGAAPAAAPVALPAEGGPAAKTGNADPLF